MMLPNESSANGVRGYLLRMESGELVFRIYTSADRKQFKDYQINHSDLEVEIKDNYSSLFEGDGVKPNIIDYPSRLKEAKKAEEVTL